MSTPHHVLYNVFTPKLAHSLCLTCLYLTVFVFAKSWYLFAYQGLTELLDEGAVQMLRDRDDDGNGSPLLAAVGQLQFEVWNSANMFIECILCLRARACVCLFGCLYVCMCVWLLYVFVAWPL